MKCRSGPWPRESKEVPGVPLRTEVVPNQWFSNLANPYPLPGEETHAWSSQPRFHAINGT
jgi:hypothetical protein